MKKIIRIIGNISLAIGGLLFFPNLILFFERPGRALPSMGIAVLFFAAWWLAMRLEMAIMRGKNE